MRPKMTIPSELAIKPEELDLELNEYNQEPFAQHLIVNVQGYYCKVCDMFFCEDEEPKKRHSSASQSFFIARCYWPKRNCATIASVCGRKLKKERTMNKSQGVFALVIIDHPRLKQVDSSSQVLR